MSPELCGDAPCSQAILCVRTMISEHRNRCSLHPLFTLMTGLLRSSLQLPMLCVSCMRSRCLPTVLSGHFGVCVQQMYPLPIESSFDSCHNHSNPSCSQIALLMRLRIPCAVGVRCELGGTWMDLVM